jgi:hypothetical protein
LKEISYMDYLRFSRHHIHPAPNTNGTNKKAILPENGDIVLYRLTWAKGNANMPMNNGARTQWNAKQYTQVKVYVSPDAAAGILCNYLCSLSPYFEGH